MRTISIIMFTVSFTSQLWTYLSFSLFLVRERFTALGPMSQLESGVKKRCASSSEESMGDGPGHTLISQVVFSAITNVSSFHCQ